MDGKEASKERRDQKEKRGGIREAEIGENREVGRNGGVGKEGGVEWKVSKVGKRTRREGGEKGRGKGRGKSEEMEEGDKVKEGKKRNAHEH